MRSAKDYLQQPYARIVIPIEEGGFHVEILEFPGCYAEGRSIGEAYKNLEKAAESWIEACLSKGQDIPEPTSNVGYSGKIALRLPRSIHRRASKFAERDRSSLNTSLVSAVSAWVGAEEFYTILAQRLERHFMQIAGFVIQCRMDSTTDAGNKLRLPNLKLEKSANTPATQAQPPAETLAMR